MEFDVVGDGDGGWGGGGGDDGGGGFWARVWVLNEETFELEREEQKKRATCKSTFFQRYLAFSSKGLKKIPARCKPASHLVRVLLLLDLVLILSGAIQR